MYKHEKIFASKVETYYKISKKWWNQDFFFKQKLRNSKENRNICIVIRYLRWWKIDDWQKQRYFDISFDTKAYGEIMEIYCKTECQLRFFYCNYAWSCNYIFWFQSC